MNAEENAATLVRQRELDEKKMRELEAIRTLLDEERQAKKDEEIVRTLQARILNEEWARRETLERLQEEQKSMLEHERRKREEFERQQNEKEGQLRDAQKRVEEMERERRKLDRQLDLAQEKTKRANLGQEVLEAKMRVKEQEHTLERDKDSAASRMTSLNPSASFYVRNRGSNVNVSGGGGGHTARGEGRSGYLPMRSASMRETSYSRSIRRRRQHAAGPNGTLAAGTGGGTTGDTLSVNNEGIVVAAGHGSSSHNVSTSAIAEVHTN